MFIELHMIQNFVPSNLNRDDTGTPKDSQFGGYRRGRISSQCQKRAIRKHKFFTEYTGAKDSDRTTRMMRLFKPELQKLGHPDEEIEAVVVSFAKAFLANKNVDKEGKAKTITYISKDERDHIVGELSTNWSNVLKNGKVNNSAIKGVVDGYIATYESGVHAPDIALFGRMLTAAPKLDIDAACHVANALSTNRIEMEMDYFTAVDDLLQPHERGAAMVEFKKFNSPCYYRYMRIDWEQLTENLCDDIPLARKTVEGFLHAAISAVPSGMQSNSAAYNDPSFLFAVVRDDGMCWSLANAFEEPIEPYYDRETGKKVGLRAASVIALDEYWGRLSKFHGSIPITLAVNIDADYPLKNLKGSLKDDKASWVSAILGQLPKE